MADATNAACRNQPRWVRSRCVEQLVDMKKICECVERLVGMKICECVERLVDMKKICECVERLVGMKIRECVERLVDMKKICECVERLVGMKKTWGCVQTCLTCCTNGTGSLSSGSRMDRASCNSK